MRIIAGEFRGRRLVAPRGMATRPTTDRVREAWFSILGPLCGRVVDLYAGTGALGFEALSRGAEHVIFVESNRSACRAIEENAFTLKVDGRITLVSTTVESASRRIVESAPYELILTDPPWTAWEAAERTLKKLLGPQLLTKTGRIVVGHPKKRPLELASDLNLETESTRSWGDSGATFWCRAEGSGSL